MLIVLSTLSYVGVNHLSWEKSNSQLVASLPESIGTETPKLETQVLVNDLDHPWALDFLPDGTLIFTQRSGFLSTLANDKAKEISEVEGVRAEGEGGLLGVTVDSNYDSNNFVYLCYNFESGNTSDLRVSRFSLNPETLTLKKSKDIVTGIPSKSSGRHSGCRLAFKDDTLWITTGDAANEFNPQGKTSLGGKVLRVDRNGNATSGNFGNGFDSRIFNYGHRNVQGIFLFDVPNGEVYGVTTEHGPDVDDEINLLKKGNFGWDPKSGYNENVPMTDREKFPNAIDSLWSSGRPTLAISNITMLSGIGWGQYQGSLVAATLKKEKLLLFSFGDKYKVGPPEEIFSGSGRIREVKLGPDNALYITTDNGDGKDMIIKITPS